MVGNGAEDGAEDCNQETRNRDGEPPKSLSRRTVTCNLLRKVRREHEGKDDRLKRLAGPIGKNPSEDTEFT